MAVPLYAQWYVIDRESEVRDMRKTRSWKHNGKNGKQYGKRNTAKYQSPFMVLDEVYFGREIESLRG